MSKRKQTKEKKHTKKMKTNEKTGKIRTKK